MPDMLSDNTPGVPDVLDSAENEHGSSGAWHVSTAGGSTRTSSIWRLSDPRELQLLQQSIDRGEAWCNFQSDETLRVSVEQPQKLSTSGDQVLPDPLRPTLVRRPTLSRPVGFWASSLTRTRLSVLLNYLRILLILCVFVLAVLSIYWGVLASIYDKLPTAKIAVVSFDGLAPYQATTPLVGPAIIAEALAQLKTPLHLGYDVRPPSEFENDPMNVRVAVHDEKYWAAIIVNSNATALLRQAVETGNSSYDPLGAAQIIYNQARDVEAYNQYIIPPLLALASDVSRKFGRNWTASVLSNQSLDSTVYSRASQALSPGISFSLYNLRPFDPPTSIPTVSIGLIYLIIIAFFSFGFFVPNHLKFTLPNPAAPHPPLKFYQLVAWRYLATVFAYFCLSLFYSFVSLAFQIPFTHSPSAVNGVAPRHWPKTEVVANADYFGHATFLVYWMLNFMGMNALGLACENMAMLLGTPWTALWLIFWVITNVSTGFYTLELASDFYRWGYAWPLRQIVMGSRTLLFGTKDELGQNFGILFAWIIIGSILFPICCWIFRWRNMREKKRLAAMQSGAGSK